MCCADSFVGFGAICLFAYLTSVITLFFLTYLLSYLSTSLRIGHFCFQAGGRKKRPNLALVFRVYFVLSYNLLRMLVCFLLDSVFQYLAKRLAGKNVSEMSYFVSGGT